MKPFRTFLREAETCLNSGAIIGGTEAQRTVRCDCGFVAKAEPKWNRKSAGQVVEGWTVRMPVHKEGQRS